MPRETSNSRPIFLSPHPDDAVLSCGGWIYQLARQGAAPMVMTIFGGDSPANAPLSPFAQQLHERWQLGENAPARRRDEDRAACHRLGCAVIHLPFADAVFGEVGEASIVDRVAEAVRAQVAQVSAARLVVPLTAGHHVDHQITQLAAECLNDELIYYEDYPYAKTLERMAHVWGNTQWHAETIGLSESALAAKIDAFLQHRSQVSTFYHDDEEVAQRMCTYAERVGEGNPAERYWRTGKQDLAGPF